MEIHFKGASTGFPRGVTQFAEKRIGSLKKYVKRREEVAQVYVDLGKESEAHQTGRIWRAEINFDFDGARFRAVAVEERIEAAITKAVDELRGALKSAQKRKRDLTRRGGLTFKSLFRGFSS